MSSSPLGPEEVDAAFAEIVARLEEEEEEESSAPQPEPPADDRVPPAAPAKPAPVPWRVDPTGSVAGALLSSDEELFGDKGAEDEDDGFVPPPPADLPPVHDTTFWLALVGLVLGPVLLVVAVVGGDDVSSWWARCGIGLLVVGFGALVSRLPRERDDDGARV